MRCSTCHDPHEVTFNDWKDGYTKVELKKTCTACHMLNMMSCENFGAVQNPDKDGFDNVRASHIWKIKVDKTAKTLNPPEGKERSPKTPGWTIARDDDGRFFLDLMWACGRTSFSDPNLMDPGASGCHMRFSQIYLKNFILQIKRLSMILL
ncbi:hypothetical protein QMK15_00175 [Campylobacter jejuni]|nr:hypothetical protein QMK15_00175 [Campylobacter jejuni]